MIHTAEHLTTESPAVASAAAESVNLRTFLAVLCPLAAAWLVIDHFALETKAFSSLLLIAGAGFTIHYFLPLRYRLPFFLLLSVFAIAFILGIGQAAWLLGIGLALLTLCHLPVPFVARLVLVVTGAGLLAALRGGLVDSAVPASVWPILGSMFMFRLAVYVYDVRHNPGLASFWPSVSYFFLLPNVCFPLFPVVDFKTFRTTYYRGNRHAIYAGGLQWIFRGVVHLLLYRLVYHTMVIEAKAVEDAADLAQYIVWPFLLYLRVSGQFHVVVGLLRLFGFNLPETHHEYFLTSSFTDFWRRINIYWKDFMMKLFYYPAYFALRKRDPVVALVASTAIVFAATWLLHSYQWFWLRGSFLFAWNDALFWALLGAAVVVNALHEWRHGRQRAIAPQMLTWARTLGLAARTVGMFLFLCLLWSLWSTESLTTWLSLWPAAFRRPADPGWQAFAALGIPTAIGLLVIARARQWHRVPRLTPETAAGAIVLASACLVLASVSTVAAHLGPVGRIMTGLRFGGLNQADAVAMERGYYEDLMGVDRFNGELWALYMNRPIDWEGTLVEKGLARPSDGFVPYELLPSAEGPFKGSVLKTNAWGMHDREYVLEPGAGCQRIAVLGASHAMGSGVDRGRTFEALLEARLNGERRDRCVEILNLAVYGYSPLHQLDLLSTRVLRFRPDVVLYVGHPEDSQRVVRLLTQRLQDGSSLPFEFLRDVITEAGVSNPQSEREIAQRLAPFGERVLSDLYGAMMEKIRGAGMCGGFVFLPMVPDMKYAVDVEREKALAAAAGFVLLDLSGVYDVPARSTLWIAEWDAHPNEKGHRLVADRLYTQLQKEQSLLECRARRSAHAQ